MKNNHEEVSRILAKVLDLNKEEAIRFIERECKGNSDLHSEVLELYHSIHNMEIEQSLKEKKSINTQSRGVTDFSSKYTSNKNSPLVSRIGQKRSTTILKSYWESSFLQNRIYRIGIAVFTFSIILFVGFILRKGYKEQLIKSEQEKLEALLATQSEAIMQWVYRENNINNSLSKSSEIIQITQELNSLVGEDLKYKGVKSLTKKDSLSIRFSKIRENMHLESMSIVHTRDAISMLYAEQAPDSTTHIYPYLELNGIFFDYLGYIKKRAIVTSHFAPLKDREMFNELPETFIRGTYISFVTPIVDNDEVIGYFFTNYNVVNRLSEIVSRANHGNSVKLYAFSWDNKLLSTARFEKELQESFILGFDSTASSIQSFILNDPGGPVYGMKEPEIPFKDQGEVDLMYDHAEGFYGKKGEIRVKGALMEPYRDYRGIEVVGVWNWFKSVEFGLAAEEDAVDAYSSLKYIDGALIGFYIILMFLFVALFNLNTKFIRFGKRIEDLQQLGQYKVLKIIGEGGFGQVFLAEHNYLKTPVAIKQLKKEFVGTDMLARFEKEVKVTSKLSHPNTIRVYDYGSTSDGQFYYVMEYLNGVDLAKLISLYDKFPVNRAIYILLQVCYSLREAHELGLVHRDIKPANIMLCNMGGAYDHVKVLDFGLVKNVDTAMNDQTQINRIGGSPMFMAPERLRDPFNADQRVDVYSIGAVGLNMLSGQYVLELMSSKMLSGDETIHGDFSSALVKRNDVPKELENLLLKCIHFTVNKRPVDINEVILALESMAEKHSWTNKDGANWWKEYDVY